MHYLHCSADSYRAAAQLLAHACAVDYPALM